MQLRYFLHLAQLPNNKLTHIVCVNCLGGYIAWDLLVHLTVDGNPPPEPVPPVGQTVKEMNRDHYRILYLPLSKAGWGRARATSAACE